MVPVKVRCGVGRSFSPPTPVKAPNTIILWHGHARELG